MKLEIRPDQGEPTMQFWLEESMNGIALMAKASNKTEDDTMTVVFINKDLKIDARVDSLMQRTGFKAAEV